MATKNKIILWNDFFLIVHSIQQKHMNTVTVIKLFNALIPKKLFCELFHLKKIGHLNNFVLDKKFIKLILLRFLSRKKKKTLRYLY